MTLDELTPGESARITEVDVGDASVFRPMSMGFIDGSVVTCATRMFQTIEFNLYGTHVAISTQIARKFTCERL